MAVQPGAGGEFAKEAIDKAVQNMEKGLGEQPQIKPGSAEQQSVQQFQQAMQPGSPESQDAVRFKQSVEGQKSLAETAMDSAQKAHADYQARMEQINSTLQSADLTSSRGLLQLQFNLAQITLQQQLMGQVAGKGSQAVNTLFKNQG